MKIKEQTRNVLEYGKAKLTWFEEIFEEYQLEERVTNTLCGFFISIKMVK